MQKYARVSFINSENVGIQAQIIKKFNSNSNEIKFTPNFSGNVPKFMIELFHKPCPKPIAQHSKQNLNSSNETNFIAVENWGEMASMS